VDWSLATWDGSRREALRRRAQLPRERLIAAAGRERIHEQSGLPAPACASHADRHRAQAGDYTAKAETQPRSSRDATPTGNRGSRQPNKKGRHEK